MRDRITFRSLASLPTADFVDALNEAYHDYYRPLHLTPASFEAMAEREAVVREASIATLDGEEIVGVALLGSRPPRGWIGGVGVVASHRRQGIARAMMERLLEEARKRNLSSLQLEVITLNKPARLLYESFGFIPQRKLLLLQRQPSQTGQPANNVPLTCRMRPARQVLDLLDDIDAVERAWSRDASSLRTLTDLLQGYVALQSEDDRPVGACLYSALSVQVGIVTLAGTQEAGRLLLNRLHHENPDATISYFNVPADDPMVPELRRAGYEETLAQFEMILSLHD